MRPRSRPRPERVRPRLRPRLRPRPNDLALTSLELSAESFGRKRAAEGACHIDIDLVGAFSRVDHFLHDVTETVDSLVQLYNAQRREQSSSSSL